MIHQTLGAVMKAPVREALEVLYHCPHYLFHWPNKTTSSGPFSEHQFAWLRIAGRDSQNFWASTRRTLSQIFLSISSILSWNGGRLGHVQEVKVIGGGGGTNRKGRQEWIPSSTKTPAQNVLKCPVFGCGKTFLLSWYHHFFTASCLWVRTCHSFPR